MKILFSKQGKSCYVADKERIIFCIDNVYFDINGNEAPDEESFHKKHYNEDDWYQYWMDYEGLPEPLKAESTIEPECEIDDVFGNYGFKNEAGEFVIPKNILAFTFRIMAKNMTENSSMDYIPPKRSFCYHRNMMKFINCTTIFGVVSRMDVLPL